MTYFMTILFALWRFMDFGGYRMLTIPTVCLGGVAQLHRRIWVACCPLCTNLCITKLSCLVFTSLNFLMELMTVYKKNDRDDILACPLWHLYWIDPFSSWDILVMCVNVNYLFIFNMIYILLLLFLSHLACSTNMLLYQPGKILIWLWSQLAQHDILVL